ncbi:TatD family hydrolase [Candidatus Bathyarchaeota archaeon]|nr:TatD family hydrolase [Candidatus Bathyarchaeota archaeon]
MFVNAHAHLRGDLDAVIQRAINNGVEIILVAGINLQSSLDAVKVAKIYDEVYACVGVHPWNADKFDGLIQNKLRDLTGEDKVVAISEIGLDFVSKRDPTTWSRSNPLPREIQINTFKTQVRLAKEVKLPIFFHSNSARSETLEILKQEGVSNVGGAIHGFNGGMVFAEECISLGFYISFGRAIITPDNVLLHNVVKGVPLEKLLIETDGGEPSDVKDVAKKVAELKGISLEEVGHKTTSNLKALLGI